MSVAAVEDNFTLPKQLVLVVALIIALPLLATDMYLPSLASIQIGLKTSEHLAQWTLSVYFIAIALTQLIYGPLSDKYGRKPMLYTGLAIFSLGAFAAAMAQQIETLILARIIQGIGAGCGMAIGFTLIQDLSQAHAARLNGQIIAWVSGSPIIAPLVGGLIEAHFNWRMTFILLGVLSLAIIMLIYSVLEETGTVTEKRLNVFKRYRHVLVNQNFWLNSMATACHFAIFFGFITVAPILFINDFGYTPQVFSLFFSLAALGYVAGARLCVHYVGQYGQYGMSVIGNRIILSGVLLLLVGSYSFPLSGLIVAFSMLIIEIGISCAISAGMSLAVHDFSHNKGTAMAALQFLRLLIGGLISAVIVLFQNESALTFAIMSLLLALVGTVCLKYARRA